MTARAQCIDTACAYEKDRNRPGSERIISYSPDGNQNQYFPATDLILIWVLSTQVYE